MTSSLAGRRVAVTGASSGIGEAIARNLAASGASVALGARREDRLQSLAEEVGNGAVPIAADVADADSARAFVQAAASELGGLDALVNNAGVMLLGPFMGQTAEDWERMVRVNCMGMIHCTHAALPLLQQAGGGDVVNVSSLAGRMASAFSAVYNLTKWGVGGFSEALRQEALHIGVRVTVIEPGMVESELLDHNPEFVRNSAEEMKAAMGGPPLSPEDVAAAVSYALAQPRHVSVNEILVRPTAQAR